MWFLQSVLTIFHITRQGEGTYSLTGLHCTSLLGLVVQEDPRDGCTGDHVALHDQNIGVTMILSVALAAE